MADKKDKIIFQNYSYTFLADSLEMMRGNCVIIHSDKKLYKLFMAVVDYVNLQLPDVDEEITDINVALTLK